MMKNLLLALLIPLTAFGVPKTRTADIVNGAVTAPKLGPGTGNEGYFLMGSPSDSTGLKWGTIDAQGLAQNVAVGTSIASNALTATITGNSGGSFSGTNLGRIPFRKSTAGLGRFDVVSMTADASVTVPAGATLGATSGQPVKLYLYAINNAGTVEAAISGSDRFSGTTLQSTTAISTSASDANTLYSTTARTNVPVYLVGEITMTQATAGQYATAPSNVATLSGKATQAIINLMTNWTSASAITITGSSSNPSKGTVTVDAVRYRRVGDTAEIQYQFEQSVGGGTGSGDYRFSMPTGLTIDNTRMSFTGDVYTRVVGSGWSTTSGDGRDLTVLAYDTTKFVVGYANGGNTLMGSGSAWGNLGAPVKMSFTVRVPIAEWAQATTANIFEAGDYGWTPYTPTFTGIGTPTNVALFHRRVGDTLEVQGSFTTGTTTASNFSISLPGSLVLNTSKLSAANSAVGSTTRAVNNQTAPQAVLASPTNSTSVLYAAAPNAASFSGASPQPANNMYGNGESVSISFRVPIQGWSTVPFGVSLSSRIRTISFAFGGATEGTNNCSSSPCTIYRQYDDEGSTTRITSIARTAGGRYTVNLVSGSCSTPAVINFNLANASAGGNGLFPQAGDNTNTTTAAYMRFGDASASGDVAGQGVITCLK